MIQPARTARRTPSGARTRAARAERLHLVDLAGSERLDRSHAQGQRLVEAQSINKSLSALAGVFASLNAKRSHVSASRLAAHALLQPALSGDGKTLLFVNLSPTAASANESLCSLRFAKQVNQVELGKATRAVEHRARRSPTTPPRGCRQHPPVLFAAASSLSLKSFSLNGDGLEVRAGFGHGFPSSVSFPVAPRRRLLVTIAVGGLRVVLPVLFEGQVVASIYVYLEGDAVGAGGLGWEHLSLPRLRPGFYLLLRTRLNAAVRRYGS